jgi:serine/threonine protein kinase
MKDLIKHITAVANQLDDHKLETLANRLDAVVADIVSETDVEEEAISENDKYQLEVEQEFSDEQSKQEWQDQIDRFVGNSTTNSSEEYLLENGLIPQRKDPLNPGSAAVGRGVFGNVFQAIYEDKEVAVKVTKTQGGNDEGFIWKAIENIKKELPENVSKHLPRIHEIKEDGRKQLIVMEKLVAVPPDIYKRLWTWNPQTKKEHLRDLQPILQDSELRNEIFEKSKSDVKNISEEEVELLHKVWMNLGAKQISQEFQEKRQSDQQDIRNELIDILLIDFFTILYTEKTGNTISDENLYRVENLFTKEFGEDEYNKLHTFIYNTGYNITDLLMTYWRNVVPGRYDKTNRDRTLVQEVPEIAPLMNAMDILAEFGIQVRDLHPGNLMMRPSTQDLVFIDAGLYKAPGKPIHSDEDVHL